MFRLEISSFMVESVKVSDVFTGVVRQERIVWFCTFPELVIML